MTSENARVREELLEHRKQLQDLEERVGNQFLKVMIALSSSTLGFSLAFIASFVSTEKKAVVFPGLIYWSWILLFLSIVLITWSQLKNDNSYRLAKKQADIALKLGKGKSKKKRREIKRLKKELENLSELIAFLKKCSFVFYWIALLLFIVFVLHNSNF